MGRRKLITQKEVELMAKNPAYAAVVFFMFSAIGIGVGCWLFKQIKGLGIFVIVGGILAFFLGVATIVSIHNSKKRERERQENILKSGMSDIDEMTGREFEYFLHSLYIRMGYSSKMTRASGDYGADLVLTKENEKIAVQVKQSINKIGLSAVQEVIGARGHYSTNGAWVVTNNYFTKPARDLAASNGVILVDRDTLARHIISSKQLSNQAATGKNQSK